MTALEPSRHATRIVVGVDFTEPSEYALALAADLIRPGAADSELNLVHVAAPVVVANALVDAAAAESPSVVQTALDIARNRVDDLCAKTRSTTSARVVAHVLSGEVATELARLSGELSADLIVVGARPRRGFAIAWHRSLSARLVRRAPCSVLTARPKEVHPEEKIEPPCSQCLDVRRESAGVVQWCARHGAHHLHPHFHHGDPQSYVSGSWTFRS